jgi:hypothetical protein
MRGLGGLCLGREEGLLFLKKKKQKDFLSLGRVFPERPGLVDESLFASFSSEKEVLAYH